MDIQSRLILTACIVNLVLTSVRLHERAILEAGLGNTYDASHVQNDFYNLSNSVAKDDTQRLHRGILKNEIAEEQQAFDTVKEDFRITQNRNAWYRKRHSGIHVNMAGTKVEVKREAPVEEATTRLWKSYTDELPNKFDLDDIMDTEEESETRKMFSYGTTMNYPSIQALEEKMDKSPGALYRRIVECSINFFWGQEEHMLESRIRERRIRKKTKPDLLGLSVILEEGFDYLRRKLTLLGDKFWNPRYNHPAPMNVESVRFFENFWNRVENFLENNLKQFDNIETEVSEIRLFMKRARRELPVRFAYIEKLMRVLAVAEVEMHNFTTTEGTTAKEFVLSLKSLRNNQTRRASIQRKK